MRFKGIFGWFHEPAGTRSFLSVFFFLWMLQAGTARAEEAHPCAADVGYGPLNVRDQSFLQMLQMNLAPAAPSTLSKGEMEAEFLTTWVNSWTIVSRNSLIDMETIRFVGTFQYALSERLQAGVEVPVLWRGGGVMDPMIDGFHGLFGLPNNHRERFPENRFRVEFRQKDGTTYILPDPGAGLQDIVLFSQLTISCGEGGPAVAVRLSFSLPTGDDTAVYGTGGGDVGATLILAKKIDPLYLYFNAGYLRFRERMILGVPLKETGWRIFSGLEYLGWRGIGLIAQVGVSSGRARDFFDLSRPSVEMAFGLKGEVSDDLVMEFAVVEDFVGSENGPDFGLHGGVELRF